MDIVARLFQLARAIIFFALVTFVFPFVAGPAEEWVFNRLHLKPDLNAASIALDEGFTLIFALVATASRWWPRRFVSAAATTGLSGGNFGQMMRAGAFAGSTTYTLGYVGPGDIVGRAAVGCVSSLASGGSCGSADRIRISPWLLRRNNCP